MVAKIDPHFKFTPEDVRNYAKKHGIPAAVDWMSLIPPDKFDGDLQKMYDELSSHFYWGFDYDGTVRQEEV